MARRRKLPEVIPLTKYIVKTRDGRTLRPGVDTIEYPYDRDSGITATWRFELCHHPRKVYFTRPVMDGEKTWRTDGRIGYEYYASVWDVEISHPETGEITFPLENR